MSIELTPKAVAELKQTITSQLARQESGETADTATATRYYVRVGVVGGGCSGFTYDMSLTENVEEHDERFEHDGIEVICDPKSYIYLNGTTIDFVDELMERGFKFVNPNATSSCGCGSSFGV
jgi:iron-sulfur cluster assembly protein